MRTLILGAAGMLGRKVTAEILRTSSASGFVTDLYLHDVVRPAVPDATVSINVLTGDLTESKTIAELARVEPDVVLHLAAVVSGAAEREFDQGMRVNLDATRALFDAFRSRNQAPVLVYASSIAVYGGSLPDVVPEDFVQRPQTSYGMQKAMGELLLAEYTRRGFLHGIGIRLPGIVVRPGATNQAIAGFYSAIIREPLQGRAALLPVPLDTRSCFMSPRTAALCLLHAARIARDRAVAGRTLNAPSLAGSVADLIEALRRVAGKDVAGLIRHAPDPRVMQVASSWPKSVDERDARARGFPADPSLEALIDAYVEEDLARDEQSRR
jgi:D-erythronate 2-dehydrogenase